MSTVLYTDQVQKVHNTKLEDHSAIRGLITRTTLVNFGYVLHVHLSLFLFLFFFCLIMNPRNAVFKEF